MTIASSLPLISIFILLFDVVLMLILRILRPRFGFYWLMAAVGALFAWPFVLFSRNLIPQTIQTFQWEPVVFFPDSPSILVDSISWPFALALSTIALAIILTEVTRASEADWGAWVSTLLLAALGLFAVQAGNPITLLMAWMMIDLADAIILLGHITESTGRERVVVALTTRLAGSILLIATLVYSSWIGVEINFSAMPTQTSLLLLLAAALRLGVLPIHQPFLQEDRFRRNLRMMSRFVTTGSAFLLMVRTATAGSIQPLHQLLLFAAGFAGLYSSYAWADAQDEIDGRSYWILSFSLLVGAATIRGQPSAALGFSLAALISGGLLFLYSARQTYLNILMLMGLFGISMLPYSLTWGGAYLYAPPFELPLVLFPIGQTALMVGYLRHASRRSPPLSRFERWVWIIYPWGLALIAMTEFIVGWYTRLPAVELKNTWPGILVSALVALFVFLQRKFEAGPILATVVGRLKAIFSTIFSMNWFAVLLRRTFNATGRLIAVFTNVFEGEGGILWAILFLVLLAALLFQLGAGA